MAAGRGRDGMTPGPWAVQPRQIEKGRITVEPTTSSVNRGCIIAACWGPDGPANAQAIAALPTMVEALQLAIAKAEPLTKQGEDAIWRPANEIWEASVKALREAGILPGVDEVRP